MNTRRLRKPRVIKYWFLLGSLGAIRCRRCGLCSTQYLHMMETSNIARSYELNEPSSSMKITFQISNFTVDLQIQYHMELEYCINRIFKIQDVFIHFKSEKCSCWGKIELERNCFAWKISSMMRSVGKVFVNIQGKKSSILILSMIE